MKKLFKLPTNKYLKIIGLHVEKYNLMMIILSSIVTLIGVGFAIYWNFDQTTQGLYNDILYLISYVAFAVLSFLMVIALLLNRFKKIKALPLTIFIHVYVLLLIGWSTMVCILDLNLGISPFIYLIVASIVAGLFVVEPFYFTLLMLISFSLIMAFQVVNQFPFFNNEYKYENIFNMFFFIIIMVAISFRHFQVVTSEFRYQQNLITLSYQDALTGLLNERSYVDEVEKIDKSIKEKKDVKFAVMVMDVNNLKAINDQYGHRFGCHLVVKSGHNLPSIFKSSKLFHVGGDEFIAAIRGKDLEEFDKRLEKFDKKMEHSIIKFNKVDLILSVARGYSFYQKGDLFHDVMQRADDMMYENKKSLKEKYNFKGR